MVSSHHLLKSCVLDLYLFCYHFWHPDTGIQTGLTWRSTHIAQGFGALGQFLSTPFLFWVAHFPRCPWSSWFSSQICPPQQGGILVSAGLMPQFYTEDVFMEDTLINWPMFLHMCWGRGFTFILIHTKLPAQDVLVGWEYPNLASWAAVQTDIKLLFNSSGYLLY